MARAALRELNDSVLSNECYPLLTMTLPVLNQLVELSYAIVEGRGRTTKEVEELTVLLGLLDSNLTVLNRYLDPEVAISSRWWKD